MNPEFWHKKWGANEIGFHKHQVNPFLVNYIEELKLSEGSSIFLPLCGKTLDIVWLLAQGYQVKGAELSHLAIEQLFEHLGIIPEIKDFENMISYSADNLEIFVGDIFNLSSELLGKVDAIYDRAALVALPLEMRKRYSAHLVGITNSAKQLLITFEYNQSLMTGPPFAISESELSLHYQNHYRIRHLSREKLNDGFKSLETAHENVWILEQ